jgi:hypothetical protein
MLAAYFCKIYIRLAARQMQISFSQPPAGCKFHSVGRHPGASFIQSAASWMQIASASSHAIHNAQFACGQPNANFEEISD